MRRPWALLALIGLVIGLFLGMDLRAQVAEGTNLTYQRFLAVTQLLQQQQDEQARLTAEIRTLRSSSPHGVAAAALRAERAALARALRAAGRTAVRGRGIRLWLDDSKSPAQSGVDENEYLIHDEDLLVVINDLNAAGAKAISLNGLRLLASTDVRCAGAVVSVGPVRTSIPVTILAVGNPSKLAASLGGQTGEIRLLSLYGIQVQLQKRQHVTVPAYHPPRLGG